MKEAVRRNALRMVRGVETCVIYSEAAVSFTVKGR